MSQSILVDLFKIPNSKINMQIICNLPNLVANLFSLTVCHTSQFSLCDLCDLCGLTLHPRIQGLPFLDVLEVGEVFFQNLYDIRFLRTRLPENAAKVCEDRLHLFYRALL